MTEHALSPEGFRCSIPVAFQAVRFPDAAVRELFADFGLTSFDMAQVARRLTPVLPNRAAVRLVNLPEGVAYEWARQLALAMAEDDGVAIGRLDGAPCIFSNRLDPDELRSLHGSLKASYEHERRNIELTRELYPGALALLGDQVQTIVARLVEPVRLLDLGSGAGGIAAILDNTQVTGRLLKVDVDVASLAVLEERHRRNPRLRARGIEESVERICDPEFRNHLEARLGGKASAAFCAFTVNQLEELCYENRLEDWLGALHQVVAPGGHVLLADFFYPADVPEPEFLRGEELNREQMARYPFLKLEKPLLGDRLLYRDPGALQDLLHKARFEQIWSESARANPQSGEHFFAVHGSRPALSLRGC